jgi:hypothetical protein
MSSTLNLDPSTLLFSISVLAAVMATVSFSAAGASSRPCSLRLAPGWQHCVGLLLRSAKQTWKSGASGARHDG